MAPACCNKAKGAVFNNISHIATPDAHTVVIVLDKPDGNFLFRMGENTAVILHPKSAESAATRPVGTGPYKLESWTKGSGIVLTKWDGFRDASRVALRRVTFRFINDPAAQVAALLAGDIDGMPRFAALSALKQFQGDKRFQVQIGSTSGKGLLAEKRTMTFYSHPTQRWVDFDVTLTAMEDVVFGDTKEGMFAIRLTTELEEKHSGKMRTADGKEGEKQRLRLPRACGLVLLGIGTRRLDPRVVRVVLDVAAIALGLLVAGFVTLLDLYLTRNLPKEGRA